MSLWLFLSIVGVAALLIAIHQWRPKRPPTIEIRRALPPPPFDDEGPGPWIDDHHHPGASHGHDGGGGGHHAGGIDASPPGDFPDPPGHIHLG